MALTLSYPKPRTSQAKLATIVANTVAAQDLMVLPKDAVVVGIYVLGTTVASAACTLNVGNTGTPTGILNAFNLVASGNGYFPAQAASGSFLGTKLTADQPIQGTLSAAVAGDAGKTWIVKVEYFVTGPQETL